MQRRAICALESCVTKRRQMSNGQPEMKPAAARAREPHLSESEP